MPTRAASSVEVRGIARAESTATSNPTSAPALQRVAPRPVTPSPGPNTAEVVAPSPARAPSVKGDRHTVREGESLWAIAQAMLGADAGPGEVARQVNRLWKLNDSRIATGDPDLLMIGTDLRLR